VLNRDLDEKGLKNILNELSTERFGAARSIQA